MEHIWLVDRDYVESRVAKKKKKEPDNHLVRILKLATIHAVAMPNLSKGGRVSRDHVQIQNVVQNWGSISIKAEAGGAQVPPFDIMFKLLSNALSSTSCVLDTALYATMF